MSSEITKEPIEMESFYERGKRLEQLGKLMQDPRATLRELIVASMLAGLDLQFRLMARNDQPIATEQQEDPCP